MFGGTAINYRYLKLMETLPELLVGLAESNFQDAIPFKFDGGAGIVMPISPINGGSPPHDHESRHPL